MSNQSSGGTKASPRKSLALTLGTKMAMRSQPDERLQEQVYAHSSAIEAAMKDTSDDMGHFIAYLRQRLELEEGYLNSLDRIIKNLKQFESQRPRNPDLTGSVYRAYMAHVQMSEAQRQPRIQYIQTIKSQLQAFAQLKEQQDKIKKQHKKNMRNINQEYIEARHTELSAAQDAYVQKWQEIDRMANASTIPVSPIVATPISPLAPRMTNSSSLTPTTTTASFSPFSNSPVVNRFAEQNSPVSPLPTPPLSSSTDVRPTLKTSLTLPINGINSPLSAEPMTPATTQRRFERFMKQFNLGSHHYTDPMRQNARAAKLKVEVQQADKEYRKMVRKVDTLAKKQAAANEFALKTLQNQLVEASKCLQQVLETVLDSEAAKYRDIMESIRNTRNSLENLVDTERDHLLYQDMLDKSRFPTPGPVYYNNYHVGQCKSMLFGISLTEYAQQFKRSPPLLVTKCIEAIERQGGLEREGIYRIPGKQSNIEKLKHCFEKDEESVVLGQDDVPDDVASVGTVLKVFLRDLASPLFPFSLSDRITYSRIPDKELRLMNLLTRILKLPAANYDTLKALMEHLARIVACVEKNKMTISNLSVMFTPAIFQDHNHAQRSPGDWYSDCVLQDLIENCDTLFADKDLRGASAITGVIQYGIENATGAEGGGTEEPFYDFDLPSPSSSVYEHGQASAVESEEEEEGQGSGQTLCQQEQSKNTDQRRLKNVSQGLKVDTKLQNDIPVQPPSFVHQDPYENHNAPAPPVSAQSAIVPSRDWLMYDPGEDREPQDTSLQRSATVGGRGTLKRSTHVSRQSSARKH